MSKAPLIVIICDGLGIAPEGPGNAVTQANTPNLDRLLATYPNCTLEAYGPGVGVRKGAQGSSEVGHLNMGAGRVVEQEILRIDKLIEAGTLGDQALIKEAFANCRDKDSALHLMGLVQDQGVHATQEHLFALLEAAAKAGLRKVFVHFFSDGRDTPPRSALTYLAALEDVFAKLGVGQVGSVMGRYYAMDRGLNWGRTERAFRALIHGEGLRAKSAKAAIEEAYARADKTLADGPGDDDLIETDEFIQPTLIAGDDGDPIGVVKPGDSVIFFNFRQDRAIQLSRAFVDDNFTEFNRGAKTNVCFVGLTRYWDEFTRGMLPPMNMKNLLGDVLSERGVWQLRLSEYQKFRHVTSFFNGKRIKAYPCEDRIMVDSISIPEDQKPEMSAYEVADLAVVAVRDGIAAVRAAAAKSDGVTLESADTPDLDAARGKDPHDVIIINFANCDMVGHTGSLPAAIKAVEAVDTCVGKVVEAGLQRGSTVFVTADHGNAEQMLDPETGKVQTAHTLNDVFFIVAAPDASGIQLRDHGVLSDIALTMLEVLDIPAPPEMTSKSLMKS